ncbi:ribonuclease R [Vogesella indigofera]|uniref:ribonuclease R n=1 Tax=Vogesella indigofera TaxID=45465 RepID=UPI00234F2458|nr:ribonuclease R [Vogesella indigofera]MDC7699357.1 ribonuclease R [Vogesella indigofera]
MVITKKSSPESAIRLSDPFLEREKSQYNNPLPSREFVLQILAQQGVPMQFGELAAVLEITDEEQPLFERRLRAMERAGQVLINRKGEVCVADKLDLLPCRVSGHKDGFGFAVPDGVTGEDIYLPEREMRKAMHGDHVMVRLAGTDRRGRREGRIVEVLERAQSTLVARAYFDHGVGVAKAEDRRIGQELLLEPEGHGGAGHGQVVMLEIVSYPDEHRPAIAKVIEVLGNYADPGMEIEVALRKHDLPHVFSDAALAQAAATPAKVRKKDLDKSRVDLRSLPLVTIDGETARDFDDAVFAERQGKGFRLVVAIADVSHYVQPGDALDGDAVARGTSVYFPRRVIPMLPEALSNGICSLNANVDRLCMVADMQISAKGKIKGYRFYPAVMNSKARLTYTQVWDWLQKGGDSPLLPQLQTLHQLFQVLLAARTRRGAIEFESVETQMVFNEHGKIDKIVPVTRNDAHRLIEECMLAANVCAADILLKNRHKCLFRIHEGPTPEKLLNLRNYLRLLGLALGGEDKPTPKDYAELAEKVALRPDAPVVQTMMLRSMQQAVYAPDNVGHFGLAYDAYTHFTSPIRRYPDLLVHRAIKAVLAGGKYKPGKWLALGEHCSMTERRADDASREVQAWLKTYYMQDKVGEVFSGKISAVTGFGVFVLLDDLYVEGLLHISELGKDYFHFKKEQQAIVGEKSGLQYRLGDAAQVRVVRANLETVQVEFALATRSVPAAGEEKAPAKRKSSRSRSKAKPLAVVAAVEDVSPLTEEVTPTEPQSPAPARRQPARNRRTKPVVTPEAVAADVAPPAETPEPVSTSAIESTPGPVAVERAKRPPRRRHTP